MTGVEGDATHPATPAPAPAADLIAAAIENVREYIYPCDDLWRGETEGEMAVARHVVMIVLGSLVDSGPLPEHPQ